MISRSICAKVYKLYDLLFTRAYYRAEWNNRIQVPDPNYRDKEAKDDDGDDTITWLYFREVYLYASKLQLEMQAENPT